MRGSIVVDVHGCARCGKDHPGLTFKPLSRPSEGWTHWCICPKVGEPVELCIATEQSVLLEEERKKDTNVTDL